MTKRSTLGRGRTAWLGAQSLHSVARARQRESVKEKRPEPTTLVGSTPTSVTEGATEMLCPLELLAEL